MKTRRTLQPRTSKPQGFSLVELMVVTMILAITAAGVMNMVVDSLKVNAIAKENLALREGIDSFLDTFRTQPWTTISAMANGGQTQEFRIDGLIAQSRASTENPLDDLKFHQNAIAPGNHGLISVTWDPLQVDPTPGTETVIQVQIDVWWKSVIGNKYKQEFTMLIDEGN